MKDPCKCSDFIPVFSSRYRPEHKDKCQFHPEYGGPCRKPDEYQGYLTGLAEGEAKGKAEERKRVAKWLDEKAKYIHWEVNNNLIHGVQYSICQAHTANKLDQLVAEMRGN